MFGGFQKDAFQPDAYQNTDVFVEQERPSSGGIRRKYRYLRFDYDEPRQDIRAIIAEDTPKGVVHREILWKPDATYADFQKELAALQMPLLDTRDIEKELKRMQRKRNQKRIIALLLQ